MEGVTYSNPASQVPRELYPLGFYPVQYGQNETSTQPHCEACFGRPHRNQARRDVVEGICDLARDLQTTSSPACLEELIGRAKKLQTKPHILREQEEHLERYIAFVRLQKDKIESRGRTLEPSESVKTPTQESYELKSYGLPEVTGDSFVGSLARPESSYSQDPSIWPGSLQTWGPALFASRSSRFNPAFAAAQGTNSSIELAYSCNNDSLAA
jgi:hypothetical protein